MDQKQVETIKENLQSKSTEELVEIWKANEQKEYSEEGFAAIKEILSERLGELPAQDPHKVDEAVKNPEGKGPLGWRIARVFAVMLFVFFCVVLSVAIAHLAGGLYASGISTLIISALLSIAAALSVRWLSKRCFQPAIFSQPDHGWMIAIGAVSILYLVLFFSIRFSSDTLWGFISFGAYMLVGIGGLWLLLHSKKFVWHKYAVVGIGIVALCLPIHVPQMQSLSGSVWKQKQEAAFQSLIQEAEETGLCTGNKLHDTVRHEINLTKVHTVEGTIIVLVAKDVTDTGSTLDISPVTGQLPQRFRPESSSDVQFLLIHGEPGPFRGGLAHSQELVAPVLLYSWPNQQMVTSGRLVIGEMGWGISRGEAYHRIAEMICQSLTANSKDE